MEERTAATIDQLKPEAAKNGIALGLISLVLGIITAYILVKATSMWAVFLVPTLIGLIVPLVLAIFLSIDLRKKIGGFWNFRQATSGVFIMFLVAYIISAGGNALYVKLVEPDMPAKIQSTVVDLTSNMMLSQGMEEEAVEKKVSEMNEDFEKKSNGTFMQTLQGHLIGVVIIFVFSLLFGAIFKKEAPKYLLPDTEG